MPDRSQKIVGTMVFQYLREGRMSAKYANKHCWRRFRVPSHGEKLVASRLYRALESASGKALRARKKARVRTIHAKPQRRSVQIQHGVCGNLPS